jgi:hypothetical protein
MAVHTQTGELSNAGVARSWPRWYFTAMSMAEIIQELPKLTPEERSIVLRRLRELGGPDDSLFLQEAAESMFQDMDQQESADARRKTG